MSTRSKPKTKVRDISMKYFEFTVHGLKALFTDPCTKLGGEKCSYHIPTYEALKGILKSIYWKPTFIWVIDEVRILKTIRTRAIGTKPLLFTGGNTLAYYTFLTDVQYQVKAHFVWNLHRPELEGDRNYAKHYSMAQRAIDRGGRLDVFLGTRDCQAYVEPCEFGSGPGDYDEVKKMEFGLVFHGFDYPDETGENALYARFSRPEMKRGIISFDTPEQCTARKFIGAMKPKIFTIGKNLQGVTIAATENGV